MTGIVRRWEMIWAASLGYLLEHDSEYSRVFQHHRLVEEFLRPLRTFPLVFRHGPGALR